MEAKTSKQAVKVVMTSDSNGDILVVITRGRLNSRKTFTSLNPAMEYVKGMLK
jgi:hypothetical protein